MNKRCKYCRQDIDYKAKVCHHCQSKQSFWGKFPKVIEATALIISIALLLLSIKQYQDTKKEKKDSARAIEMASVNLKKTEEQLLISNKLKQETQRLYAKTDSISNLVKKISLSSLQNEFIIASNSLLALNTTSTATKEFERNMHKLLLLILGNEVLVSEWVKKNLVK